MGYGFCLFLTANAILSSYELASRIRLLYIPLQLALSTSSLTLHMSLFALYLHLIFVLLYDLPVTGSFQVLLFVLCLSGGAYHSTFLAYFTTSFSFSICKLYKGHRRGQQISSKLQCVFHDILGVWTLEDVLKCRRILGLLFLSCELWIIFCP